MTRKSRAFTLMEAMVALAIAGIISAAAAAAMSLILRTVSTSRNNMSVTTNLNNSLQFISRDVEVAGGQGLPGQSSIIIENDTCPAMGDIPACNGSDRVHVFTALPEPPVCTVRPALATGALSFQYVQGGCCFPSKFSGSSVVGPIMLTKTNGSFRPVLATGLVDTACEFTVADLLPPTLYLNDPVAAVHEAGTATDFTSFLGGQATLITVRTYYLKQGSDNGAPFSELRARTGAGTSATDALIMDDIWDLQIAVAADVNGDKSIADNEWAFRGNVGIAADPYVLRLFPPRLVQVGLVQGLKASNGGNTVTVPLRSGNVTKSEPGRLLRSGLVQLVPVNSTLGVLQ